jgi:hypothetical protein
MGVDIVPRRHQVPYKIRSIIVSENKREIYL